jgi:hypothetical protein
MKPDKQISTSQLFSKLYAAIEAAMLEESGPDKERLLTECLADSGQIIVRLALLGSTLNSKLDLLQQGIRNLGNEDPELKSKLRKSLAGIYKINGRVNVVFDQDLEFCKLFTAHAREQLAAEGVDPSNPEAVLQHFVQQWKLCKQVQQN